MNPIDQAILQDEIRRALNGLFLNGQVGRTHIAKSSLFFDGDATGKITVPGNLIGMADDTVFAKMMDRAIEENEIDGITLYLNGESTYHEKSELTFEETFGATIIKLGDISSAVAVQESAVDVLGVESGTYLMTNGKYYTSEIRGVLTETIHPIDPKYLPGVTLNLCDYGIDTHSLLAKGQSGYITINRELAAELYKKIPKDGSRLVLVTDNGTDPIIFDQSAVVVCGQEGKAHMVSTSVTLVNPSDISIVCAELHIIFTFGNNDHVSYAQAFFDFSKKNLPITEVS